ncbi:hypothetical protein O4G76_17370 [Limimaricola sp. G21655-S1]|uniref:hypothetical protein n=1 Tax=Limimaricola sp. G21655-S1 TaxID=3014768 RepID=UPI0022AE619A|nr:hypothetical protein [Limimaricola sp. G21655-S1]MCZ4262610.1 hypothetical protein [Limimaricola sp. G21655-S1]
MDQVSDFVAEALGHSRLVRKGLDDNITPLLEPRHRTFAAELSRRISARTIVNEAFLRDIAAFIDLLEKEVERETSYVWHGREHDPECGYHVPVRTERAKAFLTTLEALYAVGTAIETALDAAEAYVIANALFAR